MLYCYYTASNGLRYHTCEVDGSKLFLLLVIAAACGFFVAGLIAHFGGQAQPVIYMPAPPSPPPRPARTNITRYRELADQLNAETERLMGDIRRERRNAAENNDD